MPKRIVTHGRRNRPAPSAKSFRKELEKMYRNQWVLVEYSKLDKDLRAEGGKVLAHSARKEDIYKALLQMQGKNVSIEYCGTPPGIPMMFSSL